MSELQQPRTAGLNQLQRLKALQEDNKTKVQTANMTEFKDLIVVYLGAEPKKYYPKVKENGLVVKENGRDKRSEKSSGYLYTFSEVISSKVVKVVLPNELNVQMLGVFKISGLGYSISSANLVFIGADGKIENY